VHAPVEITKAIDAATPMLYQACAEGKTLDELTIEWYRINDQGVEELYFTHTLHRVKIAEVRALLPNTKDPSKERLTHLEQVKLMYEEIEWNNVQAKKQYADSWMENA
jgi:type VI secretion system secreted protein Hcp